MISSDCGVNEISSLVDLVSKKSVDSWVRLVGIRVVRIVSAVRSRAVQIVQE